MRCVHNDRIAKLKKYLVNKATPNMALIIVDERDIEPVIYEFSQRRGLLAENCEGLAHLQLPRRISPKTRMWRIYNLGYK